MDNHEVPPPKKSPMAAPVKYAGQWVAWNKQLTEIVASGANVAVVRAAAMAAGHHNAVLQRVRKPGVPFIGRT